MTQPEVANLSLRILERTLKAARPLFEETDTTAASIDPVWTGLRRNRVNAEFLKAALRLEPKHAESLGWGRPFQAKIVRTLLAGQKRDGCWHEIHPNYDQPSALATAFMGEALLKYSNATDDVPEDLANAIDDALPRARDFILSKEERPGFFLKSERYRADHLNVDVSCGAFLAQYAKTVGDADAREAARRTVALVVREQFPDGAYPYTTGDPGPPYPYPLRVPCIHYQGVTGYYLTKIHAVDPSAAALKSLESACDWLAGVQRADGTFDWSRSHMMFAYQLSGAYAFAAALFASVATERPVFAHHASKALEVLDQNVPALALRWERGRGRNFPRDVLAAFRASRWSDFPARENVQRLGYGLYRQVARQRYADKAEARLFHILRRTLRLTASTVEPSANFPDLFMTAEVADCVAFSAYSRVSTANLDSPGARTA